MTTYKIIQEQLDRAAGQGMPEMYRGTTGPGDYTWNEKLDCYEPMQVSRPVVGESSAVFSIGGIGIFEANEAPTVPSVTAIERHERAVSRSQVCRRCHQGEMGGAMFTTNPSSGLCDDCCG